MFLGPSDSEGMDGLWMDNGGWLLGEGVAVDLIEPGVSEVDAAELLIYDIDGTVSTY